VKRFASLLRESLCDLHSAEARRLLLTVFVVDGSFGLLFIVALQAYLEPQRLAGVSIPGLALALFAAGKLSSQYLASRLTDSAGPRKALAAGLAALAVSLTGFLIATRIPPVLVPASFIYGVGSATLWPALLVYAKHVPSERRAHFTSAMMIATGLSEAAALVIGFALPSGFPFWAVALFELTAICSVLLAVLASTEASPVETLAGQLAKGRAEVLWMNSSVVLVGIIYFVQAAAISALLSVFRSVGQDVLHVSLRGQILLLTPAGLTFGVGVLASGFFGRSFSRPTLLSLASAISGVAMLGVLGSDGKELTVALLALGSLGLGLALPTTTAVALDVAGVKPGTVIGFLLSFESVGHIVGPAMSAVLVDVRAVLAFVAVLLLMGCITAGALRGHQLFGRLVGRTEVEHAS
jgi:predicted MFS family arabinose efflux permease